MQAHLSPWQPLYPSQRSGALRRESALWSGTPQQFQLQWHEDRVYFQLCGDDSTTWATLRSCTEADAISCFREALASRRYCVCFANQTKVRYGKETFFFNIQFLYAPDGTGLLREWSSRDWIAFAPKETRGWAFFPELTLPQRNDREISHRCCQYAARSVRDHILFRRVSDEEIECLSWKSATDEAEFLRVMRWLWNSQILVPEVDTKSWADVSLTTSTWYSQSRLCWSRDDWQGNQNLKHWLQSYFAGEGFEWHPADWGKRRFRKLRAREPHLRVFLEPRGINWRFPFSKCTEPTFHEQLEARHQLRDWLRDKAPDSSTDEWLFPDQHP